MNEKTAHNFLCTLNAPPALVRHGELVAEVAAMLSDELRRLGVPHDRDLTVAGAILHDAGKIIHPEELTGGGQQHEDAGEHLLLANGVDPALARCCRSHGQWSSMACSLEELLIALSDTLWKGARNDKLELAVIDEIAKLLQKTRWDVFLPLDGFFEQLAASGTEMLGRAR